ncbi:hypothetical protein [Paenibacillus wynnii]|uniref:Uncharacterized protein n=1 Tax=Paenibacillus wynnii TaxID=268407 RepID=A0A098M3L8_9BACL|nr:hypothetical protein [Paenibacillus wynnii]KGE16613.1 hypothetical protein PWYN_18025 [Paenibacillus wynnii]
MLKELKIGLAKKQVVSLHTKDGEIVMGIPEDSFMETKVKLRDGLAVRYIPYEDIVHVMRLIPFPKYKNKPNAAYQQLK